PLPYFRDGIMHALPKFGFHLRLLRLQSLTYRLPQHREVSVTPLLPADVREAKKVERLRFPFAAPLSVSIRERAELQQARLVGMQFEAELFHSFNEFRPELFSVRFDLESNHDVICIPHDDHIAVCSLPTPCL